MIPTFSELNEVSFHVTLFTSISGCEFNQSDVIYRRIWTCFSEQAKLTSKLGENGLNGFELELNVQYESLQVMILSMTAQPLLEQSVLTLTAHIPVHVQKDLVVLALSLIHVQAGAYISLNFNDCANPSYIDMINPDRIT